MSSWIELPPRKPPHYELRVITLTERERQALIRLIQKQRDEQNIVSDVLAAVMHKLR